MYSFQSNFLKLNIFGKVDSALEKKFPPAPSFGKKISPISLQKCDFSVRS